MVYFLAPSPWFIGDCVKPREGRDPPKVTQPLIGRASVSGPLPTKRSVWVLGSLKVLTEPSQPAKLYQAPAQPSQVTWNPE